MTTTPRTSTDGNTPLASKASSPVTNRRPSKSVTSDAPRRGIARAEVVDTHSVTTTHSGRKILIRDGALNAVSDEEFTVALADEETVSGKILVSELQVTQVDPTPISASDAAATESASLVVPTVAAGSGVAYTAVGGVALLAAAAGGGGGGGGGGISAPDNGAAAKAALQSIGNFAKDSTAALPTRAVYTTAGVTGVTDANLASINDALATPAVTDVSIDTLPKLQSVVDAYLHVLALADGIANNTQDANKVTLAQYQSIGVDTRQLETDTQRLHLFNDIIDGQTSDKVSTIAKLNAFVRIANAVQDRANGQASPLSMADLSAIGVHGVTEGNLAGLLNAIGQAKSSGSSTVQQLQNLLDASLNISFDAITEDLGVSATDFITSDNLLVFKGSSSASNGTKVRVVLKSTGQSDVTLEGDIQQGQWSVSNPLALADGEYTVSAQLLDSSRSTIKTVNFTQHVVVRQQADGTPDPGSSNKTISIHMLAVDNVLNANELSSPATNTWSGTAEANATVSLKLGGMTRTVSANAAGVWSYTLLDTDISAAGGIGQGVKRFSASATDSAGKTSAQAEALVTIDTVLPTLTITSNAPSVAAASVKLADSITLTFSFSEAPVGFFIDDIQVLTHDGKPTGTPLGTLSNLVASASDPKVFTVTFTPTANIKAASTALVSVAKVGYTDAAGNIGQADATSPLVRIDTTKPGDLDLDTRAGIQLTQLTGYGLSNAGTPKTLLPSGLTFPTDTDITTISLAVGGSVADPTNDTLIFGNKSLTLNTTASNDSTGVLVGGVSINWNYTANKVLTLTKNNGTVFFTVSELQAVEQALSFQTAALASVGQRTFTFNHTNNAGNRNTPSILSVDVDYTNPSAVDLDGNTELVQDGNTSYYGLGKVGTPLLIAPNMAKSAATDGVVSMAITLAGIKPSIDSLVLGGKTFALGVSTPETLVTVQDIQMLVSFSLATSNVAPTLTIRSAATDGSAFTADQVQTIETSLGFVSTGPTAANVENRFVTWTRSDLAGNQSASATTSIWVDYTPLRAIDLNYKTPLDIDATSLQYYKQENLNKAFTIAPDMNSYPFYDNGLTRFTVVLGGANLDLANDKLVLDGLTLNLNAGNLSATNQTINGVTFVDWDYNSASQTLSFTRSKKNVGFGTSALYIELALAFKTNGTTAGERTFTFTHFDQADNPNPSATATLIVDANFPADIDLDATTAGTQNTFAQYYGIDDASHFSKFVFPRVGQTVDNDIKTITLTLGGAIDGSHDVLWLDTVNGVKFRNDTAGIADTQSALGGVAAVASVWNYNSVAKTVTISKAGGGAFSSAEVKAIESAIKFETPGSAASGDRTFTLKHQDSAGQLGAPSTSTLTVDLTAPLLDLDTTTASNDRSVRLLISANTLNVSSLLDNGTSVSLTDIFGRDTLNVSTLLGNGTSVSLTDASDQLASLKVRVRGVRSGTTEKLVAGTVATEIDTNGSGASGSVSITGANAGNWNWSYLKSSGSFVFSLAGTSAIATALQAEALLRSFAYKSSALVADDVRQFFISATDIAGNTSVEAVSGVALNYRTNGTDKFTTNPATVVANDADGALKQFVLTFTDPVKTSLVTSLSNWTLTGADVSLGTAAKGASVRGVDTVTWAGDDYATNFLFTLGTDGKVFAGQAQTLTMAASTGNYVSLPSFTLTSGAITLETWVYANYTAWSSTTGLGFQRIFDLGSTTNIPLDGAPGTDLWLGFNEKTGKLEFQYFNKAGAFPTATGTYVSPTAFPVQTWQHVAVTYSGTNVTVYINGVKQGTGEATAVFGVFAASNAFTNNFIGHSNWKVDEGFAGSFYDARIYSDVRTATEIKADYGGAVDVTDANLLIRYAFNGNLTNDAPTTRTGTSSFGTQASATAVGSTSFTQSAGTTLTVASANVVDTTNLKAASDQTFQLYQTSLTRGTPQDNTITGTSGNDFIVGRGGNDNLIGGTGADTFAFYKGESGTPLVSDFKVSDGDMVDLSGVLAGTGLGYNSSATALGQYLQLSKSGTTEFLKIDVTGKGDFSAARTIIFIEGATYGLDDTLQNLVKNKVINLDNQASTPLVLDLNNDGVHTTSVTSGVTFDIQGNDQVVQTGWTDGKDGLLVLDLNQDGVINNGTELFGSGTRLADGHRAKDGFEALRQYDTNHDGVIDANDSVFAKLQVWVDTHHDGVSAAQELSTLASLGVKALQLNATSSNAMDNGNAFLFTSRWQSVDGQHHDLVDVNFTTKYVNPHAVV